MDWSPTTGSYYQFNRGLKLVNPSLVTMISVGGYSFSTGSGTQVCLGCVSGPTSVLTGAPKRCLNMGKGGKNGRDGSGHGYGGEDGDGNGDCDGRKLSLHIVFPQAGISTSVYICCLTLPSRPFSPP